MAKYTITCKCGHQKTVELFGKESERERKLKWLSENTLCSDCYKKEQDSIPCKAKLTSFATKNDGDYYVIYEGNSYKRKEELKKAGFTFGEYIDNNLMHMPKKGWMIKADKKDVLLSLGITIEGEIK